jgi:hypothetical protein
MHPTRLLQQRNMPVSADDEQSVPSIGTMKNPMSQLRRNYGLQWYKGLNNGLLKVIA